MEVTEIDGTHFLDALPEEALRMSSVGVAYGYDLLRWGEQWHRDGKDECPPAVKATTGGVQFLVLSEQEKRWLLEVEHDSVRFEARRLIVYKNNWCSWITMGDDDRNFLLSLLWIPEDPLTPLEILAKMAEP